MVQANPQGAGIGRDVYSTGGPGEYSYERHPLVLFPGTKAETHVEETVVLTYPEHGRPYGTNGTTGLGPDDADRLRALAKGIPFRTVAERMKAAHEKQIRKMEEAIKGSPSAPPSAPDAAGEVRALMEYANTPELRKILLVGLARKWGVTEDALVAMALAAPGAPEAPAIPERFSFTAFNLALREQITALKGAEIAKEEYEEHKKEMLERLVFEPHEDREIVAAVLEPYVKGRYLTSAEAKAVLERAPETVPV